MNKGEKLKFNEDTCFNSQYLKEYDENGQRLFLGYLFEKDYAMKIIDKEIIFPTIKTEEEVKSIIQEYNVSQKRRNLYRDRETITKVMTIGANSYLKLINNELKEIGKNKEKLIR